MSRQLSSMVLAKSGQLPFLVRIADKRRYFEALQVAVKGDISDLASFMASMQVQARLLAFAETVSFPSDTLATAS